MAKQEADKGKGDKGKAKSDKGGKGGSQEKPKAQKAKPGTEAPVKAKSKEKDKAAAAVAAPAPEAPKPPPPPRPPVDPRLKVLKKFYGKFLPRGPLRDRHTALMARWNSDESHGGVTFEELKALHQDWKKSREKPSKPLRAAR